MKWLTIILSALAIGAVGAELTRTYLYPTNGNIAVVGVSVKWLNGTEVTQLNWGIVDNSTAYVFEAFNVTNIKNTPCTLTLSTRDLSPSIVSVTLTWNYTGTVLKPNEWAIIELTQTVTAKGDFSYMTVITATEAP